MDKRRKNQLILLIVLNLAFFFVLDFISPTPVVFDAPETPPGFMVTYESHVKMKWRSFLIYPSEIEYSAFKPIEKQIENREYGKFIQYKVEFLEEIAGKNSFQENIQAAASMDARIMIGGDSENDILDAMSYLEEYEIILISPFISIDRDKIDSGLVLSLLPNSTEKMRLYSELLCQEKIDALIVLSDRSTSQKIADFYDINEVIFLNQVSMLNETLNTMEQDLEIGIFTEKTSTVVDYNVSELYTITVYCEEADEKLNITTKVFQPISSAPERYNEFNAFYTNQTKENPKYDEAVLYDACSLLPYIIDTTRFRPWDNPEAFRDAFKTFSGATGNCTLTENGDRMYQEYTLVNVEG